jgi:SAM-dependent methyltransferase
VCAAALPRQAAIRGPDRLLGSPGEFEVLICENCGSGVTSPAASAADLSAYYRGGYGSHAEPARGVYARLSAGLKRVQVDALLRRAPFSQALAESAGRALDVGCARGDLAAGLARRGWSVEGIEPSESAAALAARHGVRVLAPTLAAATLEREAYDLVVLRHSLEHLTDPLGDMRAIARALAPGGRVVISLPNFASWQRARLASRWFHLDLPRHRVHFTPRSLQMLLEGASLRVRERHTSTSVLGLPASVQYALIGHCIAPRGLGLRAAAAVCCMMFPLTWLIDSASGERDTLHAIAERA